MNYLNIKNFHNPGAGHVFQAKLVIDNLILRYNTFISKAISFEVYKDGSSYVFKVRLPSEKNAKYRSDLFYDVIIEFFTGGVNKPDEQKTIKEYSMRVFSNSPSFTFTFTYVYNKISALYKKIPNKMYSEKALSDKPKITNPKAFLGIEKSIFYALRKIYEVTLFNKDKIEKLAIDPTTKDPKFKFPGDLFDDILSQEDKLEEIIISERVRLKQAKANRIVKNNKVLSNKKPIDEEQKKEKRIDLKSKSLSENKLTNSSMTSDMKSSNMKNNKLKSDSNVSKLIKK